MVGREDALAPVLDERQLRLVVGLEVRRAALPCFLVAGVRDVQHGALDRRTGTDRQMLVYARWRIKNEQARSLIPELIVTPRSVATRSTRFDAPTATTKHGGTSSRYSTIPTSRYAEQFKTR